MEILIAGLQLAIVALIIFCIFKFADAVFGANEPGDELEEKILNQKVLNEINNERGA